MPAQNPIYRPNRASASARIYFADSQQCLAWYRNIQIVLSLSPPDRSFMRSIIEGLKGIEKQTRKRPASLLIIRSEVSPPEEDARDYIREELMRSNMIAAAQVVEGTGFRGATMRSVLSLIQLAARPPFPMRVFSEVPQGCFWLASEMQRFEKDSPDPDELAQAATDVRTRFTQGALGSVRNDR